MNVIQHYDLLIEENNDPFRDPPMLQDYMNQWDGDQFLEAMELTANKNVLEIGIGTGRLAGKVATLLKDNGIFVLSIDKNQDGFIDMGDRKIIIYPDTPENISELIKETTMSVVRVLETEKSYIIVSKKG